MKLEKLLGAAGEASDEGAALGSRLEEAELIHAKELEAINVKLFEEQKKNESVMLEMDNMQSRLSRAEEVEKHLEEMKAEEAKVEEQGKVIERLEETIADLSWR